MRCAPLPDFLREGAHPVGLAPERRVTLMNIAGLATWSRVYKACAITVGWGRVPTSPHSPASTTGTSAAAWSVLPHQRPRQPDSALRALLQAGAAARALEVVRSMRS